MPLLGLLCEGARTNLCLQSNAFTTTWVKDATLTLAQNATGPDGGTTAWTLTDASAIGASYITQDITLTAASYTVSVFVKKTTGAQANYPVILFYLAATTGLAGVTIDTSNGVATAWTAYTGFTGITGSATCVSYNTDFWRVSLTFTGTAATWTLRLYPAGTTNATQSTGTLDLTAQGSAVFYGAQVELGSFASSYIPTTTGSVARAADVLTYPSAGNISGTAGWCYAEIVIANTPSGNRVLDVGTNRPVMYLSSTNLKAYDGTTDSNGPTFSSSTNVQKIASTWGTMRALAVSGTVTSGIAFDGNYDVGANLTVADITSGGSQLFGTIRNLRIGQRQLSASEMRAVTR